MYRANSIKSRFPRTITFNLFAGAIACEHPIDCIVNALRDAPLQFARAQERERAIGLQRARFCWGVARASDSVKFVSPLSSEQSAKHRGDAGVGDGRRVDCKVRIIGDANLHCRILYDAQAWLTILSLLRNIRFRTGQSRRNKTSDLTI